MSGTTPVTPAQAANVATSDIVISGSDTAQKVVTAVENNAEVKQSLQTTVGPFLRTYGSSPVFCFAVYLLTWEAQRALGLQLDPQFAQSICGLLGLGAAYLWQMFSIWRGKVNAPVQPAPMVP